MLAQFARNPEMPPVGIPAQIRIGGLAQGVRSPVPVKHALCPVVGQIGQSPVWPFMVNVICVGSDPSPPQRAERGAPSALRSPLSPAEREIVLRAWARSRPAMMITFSEGRRWTATGVLISRRGPDEGSLPHSW
jgi:hypothetical protein